MATRNNPVTFEEATARIGVLPLLEALPNTINVWVCSKALTKTVQCIPSYQSLTFGYIGFVVTPEK